MAWMGYINSVYALRANDMRVTRKVATSRPSGSDEAMQDNVSREGEELRTSNRGMSLPAEDQIDGES